MKSWKTIFDNMEGGIIDKEAKKSFIFQANVVKQDIDQLLMCLGANHDMKSIAHQMDQLGRNIADLYTCFHNATAQARQSMAPH